MSKHVDAVLDLIDSALDDDAPAKPNQPVAGIQFRERSVHETLYKYGTVRAVRVA